MNELLSADLIEAKRRVASRRSRLASAESLNIRALEAALRRAAMQPNSDYTIPQLPALTLPVATDLVPIYHNGQTYQTTAALLASLGNPSSTTSLGWYNVKAYGALGNGSNDDTTAIGLAIAAAFSSGNGGVVYFPTGLYRITRTISLAGYGGGVGDFTQGIQFLGAGAGSSIIYPDAGSYDIFAGGAYGSPNSNLGNWMWKDLKVLAHGSMTGGAFARVPSGYNLWFENLDLQSHFHTFDFGDATQSSGNVITCFVDNVNCYNMNGDFLRLRTRCQQFFFGHCMVQGSATSYQAGSNYAINTVGSTPSLAPGIDLIYMHDCDFESMGAGFSFSNNGGNYSDSIFESCFFDGTTNQAVIVGGTSPMTFNRIKFIGCTFLTGSAYTVGGIDAVLLAAGAGGVCEDIQFIGCSASSSTQYGFNLGAGLRAIDIIGCSVYQSVRGINIAQSSSDQIRVLNNRIGDVYSGAGNTVGLYIVPTSLGRTQIEGNDVRGNTTAFTSNLTTSNNVLIRDNLGINPFGLPVGASVPAVPATTGSASNPFSADATVYINAASTTGFTVVVTGTAGGTSAISIPTNTVVPVRVPFGASITLTYGGTAPTWIWALD